MLVTVLLSLVDRSAPEHKLDGLVYGRESVVANVRRHWSRTPEFLSAIVLALFVTLNVIFR